MQRLRIGLVDLDTSHPDNWVPIIKELGHDVVAVYDGGTVHDAGYAAQFAARHGIERVCESLEDMRSLVDAVFVHSVNWDLHVERARPFVEAGLAVLIDKPMAGTMRDIRQLLDWGHGGARLTGGSALLACEEVQAWQRSRDPDDRIVTVMAGCSVDMFNYGIHAYSLLLAIMGPGITSVRSMGMHLQHGIELQWRDGRKGLLSVGATQGYLPFYATIVTERTVHHLQVDASRLYRSFLSVSLPYLTGEEPPIMPLKEMLEAELAALAARQSLLSEGREIALTELPADAVGEDGGAFAVQYRMKARGGE